MALVLEQVTRIELASSAWKAEVLPLNYTCIKEGKVFSFKVENTKQSYRVGN